MQNSYHKQEFLNFRSNLNINNKIKSQTRVWRFGHLFYCYKKCVLPCHFMFLIEIILSDIPCKLERKLLNKLEFLFIWMNEGAVFDSSLPFDCKVVKFGNYISICHISKPSIFVSAPSVSLFLTSPSNLRINKKPSISTDNDII